MESILRRRHGQLLMLTCILALVLATNKSLPAELTKIGIIGLDTSHSIRFTEILNDEKAAQEFQGFKVTHAYPHGSADIQTSVSRIPKYTARIQELGVEVVDSIDALLNRVDVVLLETNDGRPHLEQAKLVIAAKKPLFVDKPVAASMQDVAEIYRLAKSADVPIFSSSSLRYSPGAQAIRDGKIGKVLGATTYSPCPIEKTHPDLYWYGIHGVESLFTVMGPGCIRVQRTHTDGADVVVGTWKDGRIGVFRGIRQGKATYGGAAFGEKGIEAIEGYAGYEPLLKQIATFFRTGEAPVDPQETLEIYAFMTAADISKARDGAVVELKSVLPQPR